MKPWIGQSIPEKFPMTLTAFLFAFLPFTGIGCGGRAVSPPAPAPQTPPYPRLWSACLAELKDRGFALDRVDPAHGVIETFPLVSRQWFEFWRRDVVDFPALLESSLQTVRRRVRLEVTTDSHGDPHVTCRVFVERLSLQTAVRSGSVRIEDVFFNTLERQSVWQRPVGRNFPSRWVPLGEDEPLEAAILQSIRERT